MSLKDDLNEKKEKLSKNLDETTDHLKEEYKEAKEKLGEEYEEVKDVIDEQLEGASDAISKTVQKGVKKTKSFLKWTIGILIVGLILVGIGYLVYANWTYSEGTRTGNLIKVSKKGYVFKTYEGQLDMGGIQGHINGKLGSVWEFSLKDPELFKELEELQGKQVQLRYKEINKAMPWQGDTNYFIYDAKVKE